MKSKRTLTWLAVALLSVTAGVAQASSLDARTEEALVRALDDERHTQALYRAVLDRHGEVRPFTNILRADERHQSRFVQLFEAYDVEV